MIGPVIVEYDSSENKIIVLTKMPTNQRYQLAAFSPYNTGKENLYSEMQGIAKMIGFTFKCEVTITDLYDNIDYGEYVTNFGDEYDGTE